MPPVGELEVTSKPDKLAIFEAARSKYEATCLASDHVPTPIHEAFNFEIVPTLRRWLSMPKGTSLCADRVALKPELDAAIMPLLKSIFLVVSALSLRTSLKSLRIRAFTASWLDLNRAFDAFTAKWDMAVFEARRAGVYLPSPDLTDILKAACTDTPCLADISDGRQDDVLRLDAAVRSFLEREEARSLDPSLAKTQRPTVDTRRPSSVTFAASPATLSSSRSPSAPPLLLQSSPSTLSSYSPWRQRSWWGCVATAVCPDTVPTTASLRSCSPNSGAAQMVCGTRACVKSGPVLCLQT